ncbi:MAG: DUF2029 domain-containing protein [Bacteroidia bacterium]|nr:DUF2029 domain-containing protein [Bacteroidia bacterium]
MKARVWTFVIVLIAIVYCLFEAVGEGDFYIFSSAAGKLDGVTNIYTEKYETYYSYFYSVFFALLLKPFYYLPFFWVKFCWLMLNLFLYYRLFMLLVNAKVLELLEEKQKKFFLLFVFLFSFRFLHENIHASQITILILWCSVYGLYWINNGQTIKGSMVLALGINIKLLPIVLLPYLLYRGHFKAFVITLSVYILSLLLPGLIIGNNYNMDLLLSWFNLINPTNSHHVLDVDERSFHSLTTLLTTLFIENAPDPYAMPLKRNIANVSIETFKFILLGTRLVLVAFTLYFLSLKPFVKAKSQMDRFTEIGYILLLVPLIFPHQQHYAFLFVVPAFAISVYTFIKNKNALTKSHRIVVMLLLIISYLACNLKILLGEFDKYYQHYKILTYGALLLVPLLIWVSVQNKKIAAIE